MTTYKSILRAYNKAKKTVESLEAGAYRARTTDFNNEDLKDAGELRYAEIMLEAMTIALEKAKKEESTDWMYESI